MPYKNPHKKREYQHKYYKLWYEKNGRIRTVNDREIAREWKRTHPQLLKIYHRVYRKIKKGEIKKPIHCKLCKRKVLLSAHHTDYSKPFKILWVCGSCHKLIHT